MSISQSAANSVLTRLRTETREVHERLERELDLLSSDLTRESYRTILRRFLSFYLAFEPEVWPRLPGAWSALFADRRKLPALRDDLAVLDGEAAEITACSHRVHYPNLSQILGALYVVEGSTLGGQLIARHVARQLGLRADWGLRFFSSYGPEVGPRWKQFTELLIAESSPGQADEIVEGATQTFKAIGECLGHGAEQRTAVLSDV